MSDLSCRYLGLELRNPLVVGSSGLTSSLENLKTIDKMGAGAVVLKSVFEEQITFDSDYMRISQNPSIKTWQDAFADIVSKDEYYYAEAYEYLTSYVQDHTLNQYLKLVSEAKQNISIPVIASINCNTTQKWQYFAKKIQDAGADALELNIYLLPSDPAATGDENEEICLNIIREVRKYVTIPVSVKTGFYFSGLASTLKKLSESGINGLTLFNRPYNPDIDIEHLRVTTSNIFSTANEYAHTLRWVALLSGKLKCDIAASTGIHNHETVIKQLLAGADAVHMASVFYRSQPDHFSVLPEIVSGLKHWMDRHKFKDINDFKGLLSSRKINNPASYERVQFIRLFSGIE
ncbi:MAG TPA: dihydroorotate dehydrogenase-like protein [Bacteroidales bacterium]|nr:dihydroorotate dehydrogenase-like protein [Bacteroidales bacterium]